MPSRGSHAPSDHSGFWTRARACSRRRLPRHGPRRGRRAAPGGASASLVLEGPAGIGKTTIWAEAVARARRDGIVVRICRCAAADAVWAFSGLGDLLEEIPESALTELPNVQRQALSAALLLDSTTTVSPGDRVVAVAVLGVLRTVARTAPLVLAIDDVQWLDSASRTVLTYALRRLDDEGVRVLASRRTGDPEVPVVLGRRVVPGRARGTAGDRPGQRGRASEDRAQPPVDDTFSPDLDPPASRNGGKPDGVAGDGPRLGAARRRAGGGRAASSSQRRAAARRRSPGSPVGRGA